MGKRSLHGRWKVCRSWTLRTPRPSVVTLLNRRENRTPDSFPLPNDRLPPGSESRRDHALVPEDLETSGLWSTGGGQTGLRAGGGGRSARKSSSPKQNGGLSLSASAMATRDSRVGGAVPPTAKDPVTTTSWVLGAGTKEGQLVRAQKAIEDLARERDSALYRCKEVGCCYP